MSNPVQQGEAMRLWGEALERATQRADVSEAAKWVIGLLCADRDGKLEMPELKSEAGIMQPVFSDASRARVTALLGRMRTVNGMSAHSGIEFMAADVTESGMSVAVWDEAAKAGAIHRMQDPSGVRYVMSPELAAMEFLPRAEFIKGSAPQKPAAFADRFGQSQHPAGHGRS